MEALFQGRRKVSYVRVTRELSIELEFFHYLRVHVLPPISLGQTIVRPGKCRVFIRQLLADGKGFVELSHDEVNVPLLKAYDR